MAPNGHPHAPRRAVRDKGVRFIIRTCRSLYGYAAKKRHLPPYGENPFAGLGGKRFRIEDAKSIFIFNAETELKFFQTADLWGFPVHFILAKTGIRLGELIHLLVEDLDLDAGWMLIRNKPDLGWWIKTRRDRKIPLIAEAVAVLRHVIGNRSAGPVFLRQQFDAAEGHLAGAGRKALARVITKRSEKIERQADQTLTRDAREKIAATVWQEAGALRADRVRLSFIRTTSSMGLSGATCPKSWRHTFATLLQDANVDPLIRQLTLGHAPQGSSEGTLGMTTVYTHTRPETQQREITRALELWPQSLELARRFVQRGDVNA